MFQRAAVLSSDFAGRQYWLNSFLDLVLKNCESYGIYPWMSLYCLFCIWMHPRHGGWFCIIFYKDIIWFANSGLVVGVEGAKATQLLCWALSQSNTTAERWELAQAQKPQLGLLSFALSLSLSLSLSNFFFASSSSSLFQHSLSQILKK